MRFITIMAPPLSKISEIVAGESADFKKPIKRVVRTGAIWCVGGMGFPRFGRRLKLEVVFYASPNQYSAGRHQEEYHCCRFGNHLSGGNFFARNIIIGHA